MIEIFIILSFLFLIFVFFYKQYVEDYTLLQINYMQLDKLNALLLDKLPIIIENIPIPPSVHPNSLVQVPRFANALLGSCNLNDYLDSQDCNLRVSSEFEIYLANETGFHSYMENAWKPYLYTNPTCQYISKFASRIIFGSKPLTKLPAVYTLYMPIKGSYICSIVNPMYESSLPNDWSRCTDIDKLKAPVGQKQIQYIDIKLRPMHLLLLPAHWYILANETSKASYMAILEYHEPISLLNSYIEQNR
jgi:hypothetical protein